MVCSKRFNEHFKLNKYYDDRESGTQIAHRLSDSQTESLNSVCTKEKRQKSTSFCFTLTAFNMVRIKTADSMRGVCAITDLRMFLHKS